MASVKVPKIVYEYTADNSNVNDLFDYLLKHLLTESSPGE